MGRTSGLYLREKDYAAKSFQTFARKKNKLQGV
jgi:hypothetical protein